MCTYIYACIHTYIYMYTNEVTSQYFSKINTEEEKDNNGREDAKHTVIPSSTGYHILCSMRTQRKKLL